jgi:hypothetical protein
MSRGIELFSRFVSGSFHLGVTWGSWVTHKEQDFLSDALLNVDHWVNHLLKICMIELFLS